MAKTPPRPVGRPHRIEVIAPEGLELIVRDEIRRLGSVARPERDAPPGVIPMDYAGELRALLGLRTAQSVYIVRAFPVPRPKALLGDEHFRAILALIERVRRLHPPGAFATLFLSAAGAESAVLTRLKSELAASTGLSVGADDGDLLLRLRRAASGEGWELLVRLSPRPLATRPWRVCNREGALNGAVAHAMALLTAPGPDDRFLNIGCGSGSLLIERLLAGPARRAFGCDIDPAALECARANVAAAGIAARCELHPWDATRLPLHDSSIDAICADLPFGHLVGSHAENLTLYPAILAEAARVARPGSHCVLLSHEVRLMERLLDGRPEWGLHSLLRIDLGGLHPRIFVLERQA
ncbi:methyltransferase domain-containing protein [Oscillochloris sp. ZM17-4]|uniref:methyltransferase domain-containing protein n=1 Tax=Oscillochloris sp. ZM17-4 TaxID=2866714 RepID=UPI001C734676|nr:methyltransferase domain-containing protein [Oscillochloris sp. ZM17-4]MBX0327330.1 methyltransferase domain-containing protein [Oscillochloris sp. ZM17-4]